VIAERDRAAARDIALSDATAARVEALQNTIAERRATASCAGDPPPDTQREEAQLHHQQLLHRTQSDTPRLLWVALREDCLASLAPENLRDPLPPVVAGS
jgi:hypothetical protein